MAESIMPNTNGASYKSVNASDFITLESGVSISNIEVAQYGRVISWRAAITMALNSNYRKRIGTLKEPYRPKITSMLNSIIGTGLVSDSGDVYCCNLTNDPNTDANNWTATYVLK